MMGRLRAGRALVRNPARPGVVHRVDLSPEAVDLIVFITKDPRPMIPHLGEIEDMGLKCQFQVTLTPYGRGVEPGVPPKADIADSVGELSRAIGRERVVWRYDPVIFNRELTPAYHARKFETLCGEMEGRVSRCAFSFLDMYGKLPDPRCSAELRSARAEEMDAFGEAASEIASRHGIRLGYCCAERDLSAFGIEPAGCIGEGDLASLGVPFDGRMSGIRKGCKCVRNVDIGAYGTCSHGCAYCYAGRGEKMREGVCDPRGEMLLGALGEGDRVSPLRSRAVARLGDF
jgi:hypothetical protein